MDNVVRFLNLSTSLVKILVTMPIAHLSLAMASFWHDQSIDPTEIFSTKTPVLLLHGSNSNQQQWFFFRRYLHDVDTGHVFTVNLNQNPGKDDKRDILDYAQIVHAKLLKMKELYAQKGVQMDKVIFVGNSMGGLIGGAYCIFDIPEKIHVSALITICSPWGGTWVADLFCKSDVFPEKYFQRLNPNRTKLVEKVMELYSQSKLQIYNYGSEFDILVPSKCARLPISDQNVRIDARNDHVTTMLDPELAFFIRDNWIKRHTEELVSSKVQH